ncbi:MAG: hypothetical protein ACI3ZD_11800 [Prevotella sp.]
MLNVQHHINDLTSFMQTEVYASLDETTKSALVRKKVELCGNYFLEIASNLNRNKYRGCYAPHKAVMIMAVMELVKSGHITSNVILLDKELKEMFKKIWHRVVPTGSPFKCEYRNPFTYMDSEPFWDLSNDKDKAFISWEAFYAFSHDESRSAIRDFLIRSIQEDTICEEYSNGHHNINWMVAEDLIALSPVLGFVITI